MNNKPSADKVEPSVGIIILTWNDVTYAIDCLKSIEKLEYNNHQVVIVDNASSDGTSDILSQRFAQHKVIRNSQNLGFSEGNNVGIKWAQQQGFDYVLLLNPDTTVYPKLLSTLVEVAESDSQIGIVGPRIVYHADISRVWSAGGYIDEKTGRPFQHESVKANDLRVKEVDWVSGCAMLIKSSAIDQIGLLASEFFLGTEDVDWCIRAKNNAYEVVYIDETLVMHKKETKFTLKKYSHVQQYYTLRNLLIFVEKHGKFSASFLLSFINILMRRAFAAVFYLDFKSLKALWFAIEDFRLKRYGKTLRFVH